MQGQGGARRHLHLQAAEDAGCGEKVRPDRSVREKNNDWGKFREEKEGGGGNARLQRTSTTTSPPTRCRTGRLRLVSTSPLPKISNEPPTRSSAGKLSVSTGQACGEEVESESMWMANSLSWTQLSKMTAPGQGCRPRHTRAPEGTRGRRVSTCAAQHFPADVQM